jgi:signal transduction histidine kinase
VTLSRRRNQLRVTVRDNGVGFDRKAPVVESADGRKGGMGMRTMQERAAACGAILRLRSRPGKGTSVIVVATVPGSSG